MAKTKMDKKVNAVARKLNKQLAADVFGTRFQIKQIQKARSYSGWEYYLYELVDVDQPERNKIIPWQSGFSIINFSPLHMEMNNFIIQSDFWKKYRNTSKNIDF